MITSQRQFGVEIEFFAKTEDDFYNAQRKLRIKGDGSLTALPNGGEFVTRILKGSAGEHDVRTACELLKKHNCSSGHPQTSVHIHLDGEEHGLVITKHKKRLPDVNMVAVSPKVSSSLSKEGLETLITSGLRFGEDTIIKSNIDNVKYYAFTKITRHPVLNYNYYTTEKKNRFNWIKNIFYFYVQYSDVMESVVNNSRKMGNMYCIPLGSSYSMEDIEKATSMEELKNIWYKNRPVGHPHYDDSRYHNVNLHPFFAPTTGTIEIRSHGGTTDADKILLWLRLHQYIADKCETMTVTSIKSKGSVNDFLKFLGEDELLVEYVKRLVGYFSNIKV